MIKCIIVSIFLGAAFASTEKLSPSLTSLLESNNKVNIVVDFVGGNKQIVADIETRSFQSRTDRLNKLKSSLQNWSAISQRNVVKLLEAESATFKSYWITNQILVKNADNLLISLIAEISEVDFIEEEQIFPLISPVKKEKSVVKNDSNVEWNLEKIKVKDAWQYANGTGIVVASIDTGVQATHEALRDNFRGNEYGWFDPIDDTEAAFDFLDHGTHTMGTIAGKYGIGVAPGSKWITCRGCGILGCGYGDLLECSQFIVCPTKVDGTDEDCSKAPHVCSNSWGGGRDDLTFEDVTSAWIAGGIVPVFAIGNSGPNCYTANSPGDLRRVIAVGATTFEDSIAEFSSRGPSADGRIKPEITAPGENVRSCVSTGDSDYESYSGTSMACPHVAGVIALLLELQPQLTFGEVRQLLLEGVDTDLTSLNGECGGIPDTTYPNQDFGWGRINALKIVEKAKTMKH